MKKSFYKDFPFEKVCVAAAELANQGLDVYQKFTCSGCGQRLTMEKPNTFHRTGSCDRCSAVTNIEQQGCNYLVMSGDPND